MKVKYIGETSPLELTQGKVYEVLAVERGWYRIVDDAGVDPGDKNPGYLYPPKLFEQVTD